MESITEIYADTIIDPIDPMRITLNKDAIFELAESIKQEGLIQPITVRPITASVVDTPGHICPPTGICDHVPQLMFEVVAGHRRFRACMIAGLVKIPCIVRELDDDQMIEIRAHENLFRQDLDPIEEAISIAKLVSDDETKIPNVAKRMSKSVAWVEERLNILTYPDYMIEHIQSGALKLGVARWLAPIEDDFWRKQYVESAVGQGMSVLQARYLHDQYKMGVLPNSSDILPSNAELNSGEPPVARAVCVACGRMAIDPNLRNVFVHKECPSDDVPPSA